MSALDNIKSLLRNNGHVEAQTKETLIKCFEQLLADQGELSSPEGTIDITPGNPTEIEVTGQAPADRTDLGTSVKRWGTVYLADGVRMTASVSTIDWIGVDGTPNSNGYLESTGPYWLDHTTDKTLIFNVQDFTGNRTATFQDSSGTVAWLTDTSTTLDINHQTGTTYTLVLSDANTLVQCDNASPFTLTIPTNSVAFPIGTVIYPVQQGAGQVTVVATGGVTLVDAASATTRAQFSLLGLIKTGTNTWLLYGDMT